MPLGRGQVLFMTGWLHYAGAPPRSAVLVVDGLERPFPVFLMGRGHCPLMPDSNDTDTNGRATAFYGWLEVPGSFAKPQLAARLFVAPPNGTTQACDLGTTRILRPEPAQVAPPRDTPVVAICMATYNPPPDLFARQIASIRGQSYTNWICYISDDGSPAESLARTKEVLGDDPRFRLHAHGGRLGFYYNFERAMSLVAHDAEFVALSDQDDSWYPEKLATLLAAFTSDDTTLVYSDMRIVDGADNRLADTFWNIRKNCWTNLASLILANTVTGAASMFRRGLLDRVLPFPPKLGDQTYHDHWLAMTALASGRLRFLPQPLYDYVQHGSNVIGHDATGSGAAPRRTHLGWLRARLKTVRRSFEIQFLKEKIHLRLTNQQTAFYADVLRTAGMARTLLLRCGDRLHGRDRWAVRRLARIDSPLTVLWLMARGLPRYRSTSETIGFEWSLYLPALAWGRAVRTGIDPSTVLEYAKRVRRNGIFAWRFIRDRGWRQTARAILSKQRKARRSP